MLDDSVSSGRDPSFWRGWDICLKRFISAIFNGGAVKTVVAGSSGALPSKQSACLGKVSAWLTWAARATPLFM
jgi:hypothetical protein